MDKPEKKPYTPPKLIEYGNLVEITNTQAVSPEDAAFAGTQPFG